MVFPIIRKSDFIDRKDLILDFEILYLCVRGVLFCALKHSVFKNIVVISDTGVARRIALPFFGLAEPLPRVFHREYYALVKAYTQAHKEKAVTCTAIAYKSSAVSRYLSQPVGKVISTSSFCSKKKEHSQLEPSG